MRPPILENKIYEASSVFTPESLLREARRQKAIPEGSVPRICILDPDGDFTRYLISNGHTSVDPYWACYHTSLYRFTHEGADYGIIPNVVGGSFAVLVAEELFASGCVLLISITSAGQITRAGEPPYFVLIERALRDEGTSFHYLPPSLYSSIQGSLLISLTNAFDGSDTTVLRGATWTTDAPFRETNQAIDFARREGILGVEMEAASLYAFAQAKARSVICFAYITNQMGQIEGDFEKGLYQGSLAALDVVSRTAHARLGQPSDTVRGLERTPSDSAR